MFVKGLSNTCRVSVVTEPGLVRIGELSRRVGVSEHVLRAWERRYRLLQPTRSAGGYRLYSAADEQRVRRMQQLLDAGLSAAEAAQAASAGGDVPGPAAVPPRTQLDIVRARLAAALTGMDEPAAQRVLDSLFLELTVETALREVVLPCLRDIGTGWQRGDLTIGQEHFASQIIRGRLLALARGWGEGAGRRALLACPPDEHHDLALLAFGVVLHRRGWGVSYLGTDTPVESIADALTRTRCDVVVLAAIDPARFTAVRSEITELAGRTRVLLAGPGADAAVAADLGAAVLAADPVTAAETLSSRPQ
jgi:DNA-binding transcriptional MerR regulator